MNRHSLTFLLGLIGTVSGVTIIYFWAAAPNRDAVTAQTSAPPRVPLIPSPTWQAPTSTRDSTDRSVPDNPVESAAAFPASPAPAAWKEAKAHVERVQERLQDEQRKAAAAQERRSRIPSPASRANNPAGNAWGADGEVDPEALPPVMVPFHPQHPSLPATLPAVLADFPPGGGITPEQQAGVDQLAQDFLEAVADPLADPTDPVYQNRWQQAQMTADQLFRLRYGDYAWMIRHNAAYRQALGGNSTPSSELR